MADSSRITEITSAVLDVLKPLYNRVYLTQLPAEVGHNEFILFIIGRSDRTVPQDQAVVREISFRHYEKLTGNPNQVSDIKGYATLEERDPRNLYNLFENRDTRQPLPYSTEMWFVSDDAYVDAIGKSNYLVVEVRGYITINRGDGV